jgi:hypothetical protein
MRKTCVILYYENNFNFFFRLGKFLKKKYNLIFVSTSFFESITNKDANFKLLNKEGFKNYTFKNEIFNFYKNFEKNKIDRTYISYFQNNYLSDTVLDNIRKDYFLSPINNPREDVLFGSKKESLIYAQILLKKIEIICNSNKIDFFISSSPLNFINNCFYSLSLKKKIKFLTLHQNRDNFSFSINEKFGKDISDFILKKIKKTKIKYYNLRNFFLKKKINKKNLFFLSLVNEFKRLVNHFCSLKRYIDIHFTQISLDKEYNFNTELFYQKKGIKIFLIHFRYILRSILFHFYVCFNFKDINYLIKKKYIYLPLNYFPEAFVFNNPDFKNEKRFVQYILKVIPKDINIIIKPHPNFFTQGTEQHKLSYYSSLIIDKKRVALVFPNTNNYFLISNAVTTVSFCGTSSLESVIINKKSYVFTNCDLSRFSGIYKFSKSNYKFIDNKKKKIDFNHNKKILYLLNKYSVKIPYYKFNNIQKDSIFKEFYKLINLSLENK